MYCISCGMKLEGMAAAVGSGFGAANPVGQGGGMPQPTGPITPIPAPLSAEDDDDDSVRPTLVLLSREEAQAGCVKNVLVDRSTNLSVDVVIPPGVNVNTKLDVPGYGRPDGLTGQYGPLRMSFFVN